MHKPLIKPDLKWLRYISTIGIEAELHFSKPVQNAKITCFGQVLNLLIVQFNGIWWL